MRKQAGFTLIELLTVIAIIAILAALVFTVGPGMIERAKIRSTMAAMRELSTMSVAYYTNNSTGGNSYPPGYGFITWSARDKIGGVAGFTDPTLYSKYPYTWYLKFQNNEKLYDVKWQTGSYDSNKDGTIDMSEFLPLPVGGDLVQVAKYPDFIYTTGNAMTPNMQTAASTLMNKSPRPFFYFPVNKAQYKKFEKFWLENGYTYATYWSNTDPNFPFPSQTTFPPASYDAFVLISPGPGGDTFGVVPKTPACGVNSSLAYHALALQAYFLATRDLNQNGQLDFDYVARTQQGEAQFEQYNYVANGQQHQASNHLPGPDPDKTPNSLNDGYQLKNSYGVLIYAFGDH